jgi:hypothetical protein
VFTFLLVVYSKLYNLQGVWRGQLEGKSAAQDQAQGKNFPLSKGELSYFFVLCQFFFSTGAKHSFLEVKTLKNISNIKHNINK